jgi:hypothetical protein
MACVSLDQQGYRAGCINARGKTYGSCTGQEGKRAFDGMEVAGQVGPAATLVHVECSTHLASSSAMRVTDAPSRLAATKPLQASPEYSHTTSRQQCLG